MDPVVCCRRCVQAANDVPAHIPHLLKCKGNVRFSPPQVFIHVRAVTERDVMSDQEIIGLVARGEAEMFGELVARYQKPVFRLACSMLPDRADAEDAAQEVFIRAYKSLPAYIESGRFWGWLRRITVNVCLKKVRPAILTSFEDADEIPGRAGDEVYETVIRAEEAKELRRMVHQLPPPYRSVIVLKYLEDMSYAEIAETLGESVSNIQVRIYRAKKMLRERMEVHAA